MASPQKAAQCGQQASRSNSHCSRRLQRNLAETASRCRESSQENSKFAVQKSQQQALKGCRTAGGDLIWPYFRESAAISA
ncbi:MAG: hypothetical protein C0485_09440 [Pirellula sp.]|nr:hypothetical protein [Pirellula sp.]